MNYDEYGFPIIDDDVDYGELFGRKSNNEELKPDEKENEGETLNAPLFDLWLKRHWIKSVPFFILNSYN